MKKQFGFAKLVFVAIFALLGFGTVASATCLEGCVPVPTHGAGQSFTVGGEAQFAGMGGAVWNGTQGYALVEKAGQAATQVVIEAGGNLCGPNCQEGSFSFISLAGEQVSATAGAMSNRPGVPATAINNGAAAAGATFMWQRQR